MRWQFETPRLDLVLAITLGGQLIGDIGLNTRNEGAAEAELGFTLHPAYWRQGMGSEAATAIVAYGFNTAGWQRIFATCDTENVASAALLRKIGLKQEGVLRHHEQKQGQWRDSFLFAMTRPPL